MRNKKRNQNKRIDTCITVRAEDHRDDPEKMIRRFRKLVKNDGILEEARERRHYTKPSELKRNKLRERQRKIDKVNKKRVELLKPRDQYKKRRL